MHLASSWGPEDALGVDSAGLLELLVGEQRVSLQPRLLCGLVALLVLKQESASMYRTASLAKRALAVVTFFALDNSMQERNCLSRKSILCSAGADWSAKMPNIRAW